MESPHNAVLLLCSSSDKGCRPYMCDTSYRHANCLDQYIKAHAKAQSPSNASVNTFITSGGGGASLNSPAARSAATSAARGPTDISGHIELYKACKGLELVCPLCRGKVSGWKVVERARQKLNVKRRGCAHDSCAYVGAYDQLRKHARYVHPYARPSEVDPARQRDWWRLESQRDLGDVFSTIQSAMPGATIVGDYVIEDGDEEDEERDEEHEHEFDLEHEHEDDDDDDDDDQFHDNNAGVGGGGSGGGGGGGGGGSGASGSPVAGVDRNLWTMLFLFRVFGGSSSSSSAASSRDHHTSSSGGSSHSHHQQQQQHRAHGGSSRQQHYQPRHRHHLGVAPPPRSYRGATSPYFAPRGGGSSSSGSSRAAIMDRNRTTTSSSSSASRNRRRSHHR
ncbi:uncharacterized protein LOC9639100 isoform X2 [Selaginella moellendorffii]|nr:uncharacterized protein LOC9639100 isoform X2 [Selaginella moellendorffii]|eukprot:XP_024538233.1 uncharacterized protein LOC9639100 isoform X2 [Selaginella moellendorffii]